MNNKLHEDENENSLAYAKMFKPNLRYDIGDVVYLTSDIKKKCPMTIEAVFGDYQEADYRCIWLNSQRIAEKDTFFDKMLTK